MAGGPPPQYGCSRVLARMAVPLFDTRTPLAPLREALHAKLAEVLDAGRYILGPEVAAFERELAEYLGTPSVVGVANGTDALVLALRAMGVGPGRRRRRALVHVLRVRRGDRGDRRQPGVLRRRPARRSASRRTPSARR